MGENEDLLTAGKIAQALGRKPAEIKKAITDRQLFDHNAPDAVCVAENVSALLALIVSTVLLGAGIAACQSGAPSLSSRSEQRLMFNSIDIST